MTIDYAKTLDAIVRGGEYTLLKKQTHPDSNVSLIFYREIDKNTHHEYLAFTTWKRLAFFQKLKFFFRTSDFSLRTINRLAAAALQQKKILNQVVRYQKNANKLLSEGLLFLKEKIEKANHPKWVSRVLHLPFSKIDINVIQTALNSSMPRVKSNGKKGKSVAPVVQKTSEGPLPSVLSKGRGIINPGFLCYCNASIKALWCSPGMRKILSERKEELVESLNRVLQELDKEGVVLSYKKEPMKSLIDKIKQISPLLKGFLNAEYTQQDQQEFLLPLLNAVLPANEPLLSLKEINERDRIRNNGFEKIMRNGSELEKARALVRKAYIPYFDSQVKPSDTSPMIIVHVNDRLVIQNIEDEFFSLREEKVDASDFVNQPENTFSEEEKGLLKRYVGEGKPISTLSYSRSYVFERSPPFLPIYIARFAQEEGGRRFIKNQTYVLAPFTLNVPQKGNSPAAYELKGIVCHSGNTLKGGHYYNYFPCPGSPVDDTGRPIYWTRHSDSAVSKDPLEWKDIAEEVAMNATFYMYDQK